MMTYEHPPAHTVQVLSLPTTYLNSDVFLLPFKGICDKISGIYRGEGIC